MKLMLIAALAVYSCNTSPSVQPKPTEQPSSCTLACERRAELGCDIAEPDEDGASCVDVCEWTQDQGLIDLEPDKLAVSDSCPE